MTLESDLAHGLPKSRVLNFMWIVFLRPMQVRFRPSLVDWQGWNHVSRRMACMHVDTCHEQPEQVEIPETDEGFIKLCPGHHTLNQSHMCLRRHMCAREGRTNVWQTCT